MWWCIKNLKNKNKKQKIYSYCSNTNNNKKIYIYMSPFQISNNSTSDPIKRMSKRRDTKVSVLVLWMNIAFFTCWMPYGIVALCYIFGGEGFVNPLIVVIPLLASKSSVCWNPMLYIVMNFQVRLKLKLRPFCFFLVFWSTRSQPWSVNF